MRTFENKTVRTTILKSHAVKNGFIKITYCHVIDDSTFDVEQTKTVKNIGGAKKSLLAYFEGNNS